MGVRLLLRYYLQDVGLETKSQTKGTLRWTLFSESVKLVELLESLCPQYEIIQSLCKIESQRVER